ncbi:MAG: hypothetical protein NWF04_06210 [Candidatus Bathyarchaeota archaeon]|nr:hypothetical protein [Candidatus Bathyarchaeota archaeon]
MEDAGLTGAWSYNAETNTVSVVGGISGFLDAYNADVAGGWGKIHKQGENQFLLECKLQIGDGSTPTVFADTNKQVVLSNAVISTTSDTSRRFIQILDEAVFTLGAVDNPTLKVTSGGCHILNLEETNYYYAIHSSSAAQVYLYSSSFSGANLAMDSLLFLNGQEVRVWNCQFNGRSHIAYLNNGSVYNVMALSTATALRRVVNAVVDKVAALGCWRGVWFQNEISQRISNVFSRESNKGIRVENIGGFDQFLVNPDFDTYTFEWVGTNTGKIFRQYEFDLKVTDKNNGPIEDAAVKLCDQNGAETFTTTTNPTGKIDTQTVTRGYYDQAHNDALQDYTPHTLTITKQGYQTYTKKFFLEHKTQWETKLSRAQHILLNQGTPTLNLKPSDPENIQTLQL